MKLWRISKYPTLNGEGGRRYSARWHRASLPIVYLADSSPGALLEILVHYRLASGRLPEPYTLLQVSMQRDVAVRNLQPPRDWIRNIPATQDIGDRWLASGDSALARVPSVLVPHASNLLLNPLHPDAHRVRIDSAEQVEWDPRLSRLLQTGKSN